MYILFQRIVALLFAIVLLPFFLFLYITIRLDSPGPFIFKQKRAGKDKKTFTLFKVRTMYLGAESDQSKFLKINEADGPVFKIQNDPRFTKIGKLFAHLGIDELPQLVNIVRGEMAFVGPRPLPVKEASNVPKKYQQRFSVLPGITSSWVIEGSHKLSFKQWMELDSDYVRHKSLTFDFVIALKTLKTLLALIV